jgi:drug/metabolite transporter (DMT)-like permease
MIPGRPRGPTIALCLALMYTVGSSTYLAQRIAVTGFPPFRMVGLRFAVSGALLYAGLRARGAERPSARAWGAAALSAVPLVVMGLGGIALAVQRMPSGLAALVFGSVPLWTALFDRFWGGRLSRTEVVGLILGALGVAVASLRGALRADPAVAAILLVAAAAHALGFVLTRRLRLPAGILGTATQMLAGGVLLLVVSVARGERAPMPGARSVVALGYVIVLGSMLVYSALGYLLRNARPALASSHAYVNPLVALGLGAAFGGERFTVADVASLCLVLVAVALVALGARGRGVARMAAGGRLAPGTPE